MSEQTQKVEVSEIVLRVPGPWKGLSDLKNRLPRGYRVEGDRLWTPNGTSLWFQPRPPDNMFPTVFRNACRRRTLEPAGLRALDRYAAIAIVAAPDGSMNAARFIMEASACLIQAGGIGTFIDNSLMAHPGADWLELAENCHDSNAVFYAFVGVRRSGRRIISNGMHVFGLRDVVVDRESELDSLEDFLRMTCAELPELQDGQSYCDKAGRRFRIHSESGHSDFPFQQLSNPFGRWRLEPC